MPTVSWPFPYHSLTIPLRFPYQVKHVQNRQQYVWGAIWGLLAVAYRFLTIPLPLPHNFLTMCNRCRIYSKMRGESFGGCLPFPYDILTISLPCATGAELTTKCEGNHFGDTGGCPPFPYHFLIFASRCPYHVQQVQN